MGDFMFTRKNLIFNHTTEFLQALSDFKTLYNSKDHFENNLSNLHKAYTKLRNVYRNENLISSVDEKVEGDFIKYTIGNIELLKHKKNFLSVETGNIELNKILITKRNIDLVEECKKFANFHVTVCDFCGKLGDEIPKNKVLDGNYVLSFHDRCFNIMN